MSRRDEELDFVVIGGGFYGCCLALILRSLTERIAIVEAATDLMTRASRVNQARIHTGFHYPRSFLTALKSMRLHRRFADDFPDAVVDDFRMLYAVARCHSKVSAGRFFNMYANMGAPIRPAGSSEAALFDPRTIAATYLCREYAFDYAVLRRYLRRRLQRAAIDVRPGTTVEAAEERDGRVRLALSNGGMLSGRFVFNVTYAQINQLLASADLPNAPLKHELAEIALIEPPPALSGYGVTVVDGPFFSVMPYPAERLHSMTHVRYTPHASWIDQNTQRSAYALAEAACPESRFRHMILDAGRYLPAIREARWRRSLYEVKTVLLKNERDDGRPILFQRHRGSRIISVMGGKIDNVYDLLDVVRLAEPAWHTAHDNFLHEPVPA